MNSTDPEDVSIGRARLRLAARLKLINKLRPDSHCRCGRLVTDPWDWHIVYKGTTAICRQCAHELKFIPKNPVKLHGEIFSEEIVVMCRINPARLAEARQASGISLRQFAFRCGWSLSFQQDLEKRIRAVELPTARKILTVLAENNVSTSDVLSKETDNDRES